MRMLLLIPLLLLCQPGYSGALEKAQTPRVELIEQLGEKLPLELSFTDSKGQQVQLGQLIDKPTLIVPVYYDCRNVCNFVLGGLAQVLPEVKLKAGQDFQVITLSFDPEETVELAKHSKKTYLTAIQAPFPENAWHFLTGKQENILRLTNTAGYYFAKQGEDFLHPVAAFVVSSDGTIVRYLIGQRFMPLDLTMALYEASEGRIGTPIRKALEFCFSYDPEGRRYVFNLLRVSGTVILLTLGSFLLFLILSGRKKKQ
ncbi:SCO family protein [Malonomonas rubra]|uniref:SCO family protein n=1 Tax=Malonomonas rubra TaxID=57040 RepID=UPI0026ED42E8|nr:SCO family protein [Malonomonas rubra]